MNCQRCPARCCSVFLPDADEAGEISQRLPERRIGSLDRCSGNTVASSSRGHREASSAVAESRDDEQLLARRDHGVLVARYASNLIVRAEQPNAITEITVALGEQRQSLGRATDLAPLRCVGTNGKDTENDEEQDEGGDDQRNDDDAGESWREHGGHMASPFRRCAMRCAEPGHLVPRIGRTRPAVLLCEAIGCISRHGPSGLAPRFLSGRSSWRRQGRRSSNPRFHRTGATSPPSRRCASPATPHRGSP